MKAITVLKERERTLNVLLGAAGMRIGEALGIEIDKHFSDDFSTLLIRQKVWNGHVQSFLKTENGVRDIDLHPSIAKILKKFVGNRNSGFLFCSKSGNPLLQSNILRLSLHPILEELKQPKSGAHAFRRFRTTWLRKQNAPEDLIRFWLGHANKSVTDGYSKLKEDVMFLRRLRSKSESASSFQPKGPKLHPIAPKLGCYQPSLKRMALKRKTGSPG